MMMRRCTPNNQELHDTSLVREIVDRLTRVTRPDRIILFGSGATGHMTRDSDVDVLVVQPEVRDPGSESRRLREALVGLAFRST
jgi:predicted nucleotidyltransferase